MEYFLYVCIMKEPTEIDREIIHKLLESSFNIKRGETVKVSYENLVKYTHFVIQTMLEESTKQIDKIIENNNKINYN